MFSYDHAHPAVSVDIAVFRQREKRLEVLLIRRGADPFAGCWALPGGFVGIAENLETAAERELAEDTGLTGLELEQRGAFGEPQRDPRERVISVAYWLRCARRGGNPARVRCGRGRVVRRRALTRARVRSRRHHCGFPARRVEPRTNRRASGRVSAGVVAKRTAGTAVARCARPTGRAAGLVPLDLFAALGRQKAEQAAVGLIAELVAADRNRVADLDGLFGDPFAGQSRRSSRLQRPDVRLPALVHDLEIDPDMRIDPVHLRDLALEGRVLGHLVVTVRVMRPCRERQRTSGDNCKT